MGGIDETLGAGSVLRRCAPLFGDGCEEGSGVSLPQGSRDPLFLFILGAGSWADYPNEICNIRWVDRVGRDMSVMSMSMDDEKKGYVSFMYIRYVSCTVECFARMSNLH